MQNSSKILLLDQLFFELQTGSVTGFVAGESAHEVELLLAKKNQIVKIIFNAVKFNLENSIYLLNKLSTEEKFTLKNYQKNEGKVVGFYKTTRNMAPRFKIFESLLKLKING